MPIYNFSSKYNLLIKNEQQQQIFEFVMAFDCTECWMLKQKLIFFPSMQR